MCYAHFQLNHNVNLATCSLERKTPKKLPDPDGPLSTSIPSSSISAANSKVQPLLETATATVNDTIKN